MTKTELKPCPFCGEKAHIEYNDDFFEWNICCSQCPCDIGFEPSKDKIIEKWNTRYES